ncbi:MAG: hypothetical protein WAK24_12030, partial [Candidatus Acidiferrales bacterium]
PENHLLRLLDRHISFDFVREKLKDSYSDTGRPSPLQSGSLPPACYQQPVRNLWIITPREESSPSNCTTP